MTAESKTAIGPLMPDVVHCDTPHQRSFQRTGSAPCTEHAGGRKAYIVRITWDELPLQGMWEVGDIEFTGSVQRSASVDQWRTMVDARLMSTLDPRRR